MREAPLMPIAAHIDGRIVGVVRKSWQAFGDVKEGSNLTLWVSTGVDQEPLALRIDDRSGWWQALATAQLGDEVEVDVNVYPTDRGNGRPGLRYQVLDLGLRKPGPRVVPNGKSEPAKVG